MLSVQNTCQDPIGVKMFEFLHPLNKSTEGKTLQVNLTWSHQASFRTETFVWFDKQCLAFTLFSAQAKIQILTTSCQIFTSLLKSLGLQFEY